MPATVVKFVEVVAPVQIEISSLVVVPENFDIVVEQVPGHVLRFEVVAP